MGYENNNKHFENSPDNSDKEAGQLHLTIDGDRVELPDASYVRDAEIKRSGADLVLETEDGSIVIEGYFSSLEPPVLVADDGSALSPQLIDSFVQNNPYYAGNAVMNDESPVGAVQEITGEAFIIRGDGQKYPIEQGTKVFQGDVIETESDGAVNIIFIDETSFAIAEDTRMAIDEYVFDAESGGGVTNFSVLKGLFVFTSGLIGREDPDDVMIDTPVGSIGIRGTIIAGDVDNGEITVIEGAIVLRNSFGNELSLASQFDTGRFEPESGKISRIGVIEAQDVTEKFVSISRVSPDLFSSLQDTARENSNTESDADNSVDQNGDNQVDSTIENQNAGEGADQNAAPADQGGRSGHNQLPADSLPTGRFGEERFSRDGVSLRTDNTMRDTSTQTGIEAGDSLTGGDEGTRRSTGSTGNERDGFNDRNNSDPVFTDNNTNSAADPFEINIVPVASINEDTPGLAVASLSGVNGDEISAVAIDPASPFASLFEALSLGGGNFQVSLQSLSEVDYDELAAAGLENSFGVGVRIYGTNGEFTTRFINVNVNDIDELPLHIASSAVPDHNIAPAEFFAAGEGRVFQYNFANEFLNTDFNDTLTYELSTATQTALDDLLVGAPGVDILDTWNFNNATGILTLDFANNMAITPDTAFLINLEIDAFDAAGNYTGGTATPAYNTYSFNAYKPSTGFEASSGSLDNVDNETILGAGDITIGSANASSSNIIFMDDNSHTVTLFSGNNNTVHLGNGDNTAVVADDPTLDENIFIGGLSKDTFIISNSENKFYGMNGDDDFIINVTSANFTAPLNATFDSRIMFDGGNSAFRAGDAISHLFGPLEGPQGIAGGRGDSLVLDGAGAGNLDFTGINDAYFKSIERIDAANAQANVLTLNYNDVLAMTDGKNTLIINLDSYDTLNLVGTDFDLTGPMERKGNDISIDDSRAEQPADFKNYDVFSDGNVTLLIHDQGGGAAVNFDGTAVPI